MLAIPLATVMTHASSLSPAVLMAFSSTVPLQMILVLICYLDSVSCLMCLFCLWNKVPELLKPFNLIDKLGFIDCSWNTFECNAHFHICSWRWLVVARHALIRAMGEGEMKRGVEKGKGEGEMGFLLQPGFDPGSGECEANALALPHSFSKLHVMRTCARLNFVQGACV